MLLPNSPNPQYNPLIGASTGTLFYCSRCPRSIRKEVPFESFNHWGLPFWGQLRLRGYGLLPEELQIEINVVENRLLICRWLSLLEDGQNEEASGNVAAHEVASQLQDMAVAG